MSDFSDTGYDSIGVDHDGDGFAETTYADTTGDGTIDTVAEYDPYTGASAVAADTTGDGVIDTVAVDYDGDGLIDEAFTEDATTDDGPFVADDELVDTADTADLPDDGDGPDDGIHGEPRADIDYHQVQPGPVDCLPTSVSMALSEITGTHVPADELVAMANEHGFMTDTGMSALDSITLFENYGVEAEATSGTLDDLRDALDRGDPIIVGIDAADLYSGGGGPFDPGMESGHAVVVTGIDDGPPGVLYINDPGFPDGAGVEIPLELFEDAWEDSENTMVVATAPAEVDAGAAEVGAVGAEESAEGAPAGVRRLLLLPLTFLLKA